MYRVSIDKDHLKSVFAITLFFFSFDCLDLLIFFNMVDNNCRQQALKAKRRIFVTILMLQFNENNAY